MYAYLLSPRQGNSGKGGNSVGFLLGCSDWKILYKSKTHYSLCSHKCPKAMLGSSPMYLSGTSSSFNLIRIHHCNIFSVHKNTLPSCYDGIGYQESFLYTFYYASLSKTTTNVFYRHFTQFNMSRYSYSPCKDFTQISNHSFPTTKYTDLCKIVTLA